MLFILNTDIRGITFMGPSSLCDVQATSVRGGEVQQRWYGWGPRCRSGGGGDARRHPRLPEVEAPVCIF